MVRCVALIGGAVSSDGSSADGSRVTRDGHGTGGARAQRHDRVLGLISALFRFLQLLLEATRLAHAHASHFLRFFDFSLVVFDFVAVFRPFLGVFSCSFGPLRSGVRVPWRGVHDGWRCSSFQNDAWLPCSSRSPDRESWTPSWRRASCRI